MVWLACKNKVHQEPYDHDKYMDSMAARQRYEAGFNFMRLQSPYSPTPGVPVIMSRLESLMAHVWQTPETFEMPLVVAMASARDDPMQKKGALRCLTPEELRYSFLFAIERDILAEAPDQTLEAWKAAILSVTVQFRVIEVEADIYWEAHKMRETLVTKLSAVKRSAYARIYEVANARANLAAEMKVAPQKIGAQRLLDEYLAKTSWSPESGDKLNFGFIDAALTCWDRALVYPSVNGVVQYCEASGTRTMLFERWNIRLGGGSVSSARLSVLGTSSGLSRGPMGKYIHTHRCML